MPLFLVEHTHPPESCPTKNLEMVRQLASHVTQATAERPDLILMNMSLPGLDGYEATRRISTPLVRACQ
jgi:CheY-like chemotaxis protein